jgi:hypothetical protein
MFFGDQTFEPSQTSGLIERFATRWLDLYKRGGRFGRASVLTVTTKRLDTSPVVCCIWRRANTHYVKKHTTQT